LGTDTAVSEKGSPKRGEVRDYHLRRPLIKIRCCGASDPEGGVES